jgi:hypothetical protein
MADDAHYYGVAKLSNVTLQGGYATWSNPNPIYTTTDVQPDGFTLTAIWVITGTNTWVEVGYTQGFEGFNNTLLYYAESLPIGAYYETAIRFAGTPGQNHTYQIEWDPYAGYWTVLVDGQNVGYSLQHNANSYEMHVGGEMTSPNNVLTNTFPDSLRYRNNGVWQYWDTGGGTILSYDIPPLSFDWVNPHRKGVVYTANFIDSPESDISSLGPVALQEATMPENPRSGAEGPLLSEERLSEIIRQVARSHGAENAQEESRELTTHGEARARREAGHSHTVADDRQVFRVVLHGHFTFRRRPAGGTPIFSDTLEIEIDAFNGDILVAGTPEKRML